MERAQFLKCSHCRLILGHNLKKTHNDKIMLDTH